MKIKEVGEGKIRKTKNVRLTDEAIPGMSGDQTGVLDVVVLR